MLYTSDLQALGMQKVVSNQGHSNLLGRNFPVTCYPVDLTFPSIEGKKIRPKSSLLPGPPPYTFKSDVTEFEKEKGKTRL